MKYLNYFCITLMLFIVLGCSDSTTETKDAKKPEVQKVEVAQKEGDKDPKPKSEAKPKKPEKNWRNGWGLLGGSEEAEESKSAKDQEAKKPDEQSEPKAEEEKAKPEALAEEKKEEPAPEAKPEEKKPGFMARAWNSVFGSGEKKPEDDKDKEKSEKDEKEEDTRSWGQFIWDYTLGGFFNWIGGLWTSFWSWLYGATIGPIVEWAQSVFNSVVQIIVNIVFLIFILVICYMVITLAAMFEAILFIAITLAIFFVPVIAGWALEAALPTNIGQGLLLLAEIILVYVKYATKKEEGSNTQIKA